MNKKAIEQIVAEDLIEKAEHLHGAGDWSAAESLYREILARHPGHFEALYRFAILKADCGAYESGLRLMEQALVSSPASTKALLAIAKLQTLVGDLDSAVKTYEKVLRLEPAMPEVFYEIANVFSATRRYEQALAYYNQALQFVPEWPEVLTNRGNVLHDLRRYQEALDSYDRAIQLMPSLAMLHSNRGNVLRDMRRWPEALESLSRALSMAPDYVDAIVNLGNVLQDMGRSESALEAYDRALRLDPNNLVVLSNRGNVLRDLRRHAEAAATVGRLLELAPDWDYAPGLMLQSLRQVCDWSDYSRRGDDVVRRVRAGLRADIPFSFLALSDSIYDQLRCSQIYVADRYPASANPVYAGNFYDHDKIRVAYLSADFHNHATSYLMAGLFERHDKTRFDIYAVSFGPDAKDEMRTRLQGAFSKFVDVRDKTDREVAEMLRDWEVDIAVDLKGFTADCRAGIFAFRPAPIQVSYLGYPGTMGADYIDYIIADRHVIPEGHHAGYAEKVAYLPDSYQVNDCDRVISSRAFSRFEVGLPRDAFVFCCFNNNYKITPAIFEVWMRLLAKVPDSVMWLLDCGTEAIGNLRREASSRGIMPERLVFAAPVDQSSHLARHRLADLFLDTLPYNAHTTASDALWAGLPVLTCAGNAFAGRVGASLLHAVGLSELVTESLEDYEAHALRLATDRGLLQAIKLRLEENRNTHPLFDTERFKTHIEAAYAEMWRVYRQGVRPRTFAVDPVPGR